MYSTPTIKPIETANFGRDVAAAGQGIAQTFGGIAEGITAVNKEKKRQQLIQILQQEKPFLEVDPNTPFDELAKGLHQINQVSLRYDLAKKAGARLPDEKQMYKAAFHADEKSVEKFSSVLDDLGKVASTEKFKQETEQQKEQRSAQQSKLMSDYMQKNPNATREEAYQAIAQQGFSGAAAGAEGMKFTEGMAQTGAEKTKEMLAFQRLKISKEKAQAYIGKEKADTFYRDASAVDKSLAGYANVYKTLEEYENKAEVRDANRMKYQQELTTKSMQSGKPLKPNEVDAAMVKYDQATQKLRSIAKSFRKTAQEKRTMALSLQNRFDTNYPGAREVDPEMDSILNAVTEPEEKVEEPGSSEPAAVAPAPATPAEPPAGGLPGAQPARKRFTLVP